MTRLERIAIVAVAVLRAVLAGLGPMGVFPDSARYRSESDTFAVFDFFAGQGPGQLLQVINLLPLRMALGVQTLVAALLWAWAIIVATRELRRPWFWLLFALSLSPWWLVWDWSVLTEGITIAAMALFAAGTARWIGGEPEGPMIIGAVVALLTRPLMVPLVLGVLVVAIAARRQLPGPRWVCVALLVILVFAGIQSIAFNRALAQYTYLPRPLTLASIQAGDRMGARSQVPGYMALAEKYGMPECPEARTIPYGFPGAAALRRVPCPAFSEWLDSGGLPWWAELLHNTRPTLAVIVSGPWLNETWTTYAGPAWAPFLELTAIQRRVDLPMWIGSAFAAVGLLLPGRGWLVRVALVSGVVGYSVILLMVDGMENWRHMLPALAVLLPLAVGCLPRVRDRDGVAS